MTAQLNSNNSLLVFTDLDEEFDDKLAVYFISKFGINTIIVFIPSSQGSSQDGFDEWKRIYPIWNKIPHFTYMTFEEFVKVPTVVCDYVLQISPMANMEDGTPYTGHNLTVNKEYVFGGIYRTKEAETPSFNLKGSHQLLEKFQNKLIEISSEYMAAKRPFIGLYNLLPLLFKENMCWTSFKLAIGRMSLNHPVAHIYAEGLINPLCGRGANLTSVEQMYSSVFAYEIQNFIVPAFNKIILDKNRYKKTYQLTKQYLDTIKAKHPMSEKNLFRMNIALSVLFPGIWDNQDQLISISSDKTTPNDPKIQILWKRFQSFNIEKVIKTFNPVYDLFAAYILLNVINSKFENIKFSVEDDYQNEFDTFITEYMAKGNHGENLVQ